MRTTARSVGLGLVLCAAIAAGCRRGGPPSVTFLHFNDVYEIGPVEGGRAGGLARVATVIRELRRTHAPVVTTLGGDFLSPSALGTARIDGQPIFGQQMVDVLNLVGLDWATFGNHEFDLTETAFRARLAQAKFRIVSTNVFDVNNRPFPGTVPSEIISVSSGGRQIRIGLIGLTTDANTRTWVNYRFPIQSAREEIARMGTVDAIVALTHLSLADDQALVAAVPEIALVLGGHEHENWLLHRGAALTPIVKADANARTVAVVTLSPGESGTRPQISVRLQPIGETTAADAGVEQEVRRWTQIAFAAFSRDGFHPENVVARLTEPLDGREATVRNKPGRLTSLIADALAREAGGADAALMNGGSIRIDDELTPGPVTEYDVIRVLPFGGRVVRVSMPGSLLTRVLDTGAANAGTGGYLQTAGVTRVGSAWTIGGRPIHASIRYTVAMTDFLLSGRETNLDFLTRTNPLIRDVQEFRDIRQAVIDALKARYPR